MTLPIPTWHVYLIECSDGTLYCGITTDLERRLAAHDCGEGARYTRGRGPVRLRWHETWPDKGAALRRELEVKRLPREAKLALLARAKEGPASQRTVADS